MTTTENKLTPRPPVIVVMGHIDHGKSTLLDFIRKTNVVAGEAGGITQLLSAYEVVHKTPEGKEQKITFLDTPGHAAFSGMRLRGAHIADIGILVVSAEDGVKAQTLEALKTFEQAKIPFVVAINKIDRPNANVQKTKGELAEHGIYLEGYGGQVSFVEISAKTGDGVPELLDMLLLTAELEELTGDTALPASGIVIESNVHPKKGISATLIIKNGTLRSGMFVVAGDAISPVRIMEDFLGKNIKEATFSSPVGLLGFSKLPVTGCAFESYNDKKDAEKVASVHAISIAKTEKNTEEQNEEMILIPLIIKTSVLGTIEAITQEVSKLKTQAVTLKIIHTGVGNITENDVRAAGGNSNTIIVGFHVAIEPLAKDLAERMLIEVHLYDVIYKLTEWLEELVKTRTPKVTVEEQRGIAKVLKTFSSSKDSQIVGGTVTKGIMSVGESVKILRHDEPIGEGVIVDMQQQKLKVKNVEEGNQFGVTIKSKMLIAAGDKLQSFVNVTT